MCYGGAFSLLIAEISPGKLDGVRLVSIGGESNGAALRLAKRVSG